MKCLRCLAALVLIFSTVLAGCSFSGANVPTRESPGGGGASSGSGGGY